MGQAASLESRKRRKPYRARANTMKATPPPLAAFRETRPSLPEYTLTQYEVKQLMKSFHEAMQRGDTRTTSSAESEAEDELMEQIHGQFGPQPRTRSMIRSTTSNASEDSGIDENGHSPRHSLDDLTSLPVFARTIGDDTPMALTPATPVVISMLNFTPPAEQIDLDKYINPQPKRRRFIPKRLFGKKKVRASQRQRSKSLGSYDALSAKGWWLCNFYFHSYLNKFSIDWVNGCTFAMCIPQAIALLSKLVS